MAAENRFRVRFGKTITAWASVTNFSHTSNGGLNSAGTLKESMY